jgi:hypothetical protein
MRQAPPVDQVSLFGPAIPGHFHRVDSINLWIAFPVVLVVQTGFRPAHAAHHKIAEGIAFLVFRIALLAKPLGGRGQQLILLRHPEPPRQELPFLPDANFLTGHAVDGCSYALKMTFGRFASCIALSSSLSCSPASKSKFLAASRAN